MEKDETEIEITPEMISAGALALYRDESIDVDLAWAEALATRVLEAALKTRAS